MIIGKLSSKTQSIKRINDIMNYECVLGLNHKENNLVDVQRSAPHKSITRYKQLIPEDFASVSHFRATSIVDSRLSSNSQPEYSGGEALRTAIEQ